MRRHEHALQISVARMLDLVLDPEKTWWTSIDHGVGKLGKAEAGIRKARGVKAGLPDIVILVDQPDAYGCPTPLGIELKAGDGRLSPAQTLTQAAWERMGFACIVEARSLEDVHEILVTFHVPLRRRMKFFGGNHARPQRASAARHSRTRRRGKSKNHLPLVFGPAPQKE